MIWYAAHLVFYVKFKHRRQTRYPVWENIVLISAKNVDEAFDKAEKRAQDDACMYPDDTFTWGGHPAEWVFGGVRKLTTCMDEDTRPRDGTEVTYLEFKLASKAALEKLIRGEPVSLLLDDGFPDDEFVEQPAIAANGRKEKQRQT